MYGFIHCCLEDMVLQLFGEPAWREILNVAGIKLRGASFLMHQVYDDETTFKLVAAASQVSGLPMEACLEEFGKHFLVYCQKNGYDQILRVLGSNLYDFLTNLDNLHDHLASIYPGMRAPSFRVTRQLESNGSGLAASTAGQLAAKQQQQRQLAEESSQATLAAGSMYLHYYSERNGLSPIVKGLVLAVAREFFSTDIVVTECKLLRPQQGHAHDHVVLKIDRRSQGDILLDEQTSQAVTAAAQQRQQVAAAPSPDGPRHQAAFSQQQQMPHKTALSSAFGDTMSKLASDSLINSEIMMQTFPFHVIFDRHFNLVQVGNALLRVTSLFWQRRQRARAESPAAAPEGDLIKFSDLFSIVRPKIEFTFDAIADHTNQVFVVKTRPLVLNADYLRLVADQSASGDSGAARDTVRAGPESGDTPPRVPSQSLCPMSRMAMKRRSCAPRLSSGPASPPPPPSTKTEDETGSNVAEASAGDKPDTQRTTTKRPSAGGEHHENDSGNELSAFNLLSLRLKGQMIILNGPMGLSGAASINQDQAAAGDERHHQQGPFCLYLCSPRVDHLDQLMECGVKMSDLALHDRARELMLMSHTHKEDREAVKKLDQATNDLKKMDTKLRQENKRTNEVLHNIFPAKIAALLSHGTKIESESFDPVTCLYSDIIGFTKMCGSENVRPIDIVRLLNTLYLQFDNLTNIHGVYKVETIGDAYVIVGGLPEPLEDHADRCVRMGLDMVKVIATVRSPADNQPIQMRIGIHSGPVMAGIVGIRVPRYSLFGNTTTLANQLETNGVGGKIHISDVTLKNLIKRDRFVIEDNPNQIGGFPCKTYFVTNYLGDQRELLKHEKILEEQLIKDFELMGNEVELVDDNSRTAPRPSEPAGGAPSDPNRPAPDRIATRGANRQAAAEVAERICALKPSSGAGQPSKETSEATVLMDVEETPWTTRRPDGEPSKELVELSRKLSDDIVAEALAQYADLQMLERLLGLLTNRHTSARLATCLGLGKEAAHEQRQWQAADGSRAWSCPFCLDGKRAEGDDSSGNQRQELIAIATSVALALVNGISADAARPVPSDGRARPSSTTEARGMGTRTGGPLAITGAASDETAPQPNDSRSSQQEVGQLAPANGHVSRMSPQAASALIRETLNDAHVCGRGGSITAPEAAGGTTKPAAARQAPARAAARDSNQELARSPDIISGFERALDSLRLEREGLATQVQQLRQCLNKLSLAGGDCGGGGAPEPPVGPTQTARLGAGPTINRPPVLSSNMQRMKRMDTLQRRKIKREQQQQQPRPPTSPLSASSLAEAGQPDETSNPARKQRADLSGRQPQQSVLAYHQSPGENNNLSRTLSCASSAGGGGGAGAAILESADEELALDEELSIGHGQCFGQRADCDPIESGRRQSLGRTLVTPSGPDQAAAEAGDKERRGPARQRPQLKQQQSAAAATAHIYQSVRSSLASLLNETVGPQRPGEQQTCNKRQKSERRKRFSLNTLGMNLSAAIGSPFSSPKRGGFQGRKPPSGAPDGEPGKERPNSKRGSSSRSQSGSSTGGNPAGNQQASDGPRRSQQPAARRESSCTPTSTKRQSSSSGGGNTVAHGATNCSCLRSSGSNYSVESENRMIK